MSNDMGNEEMQIPPNSTDFLDNITCNEVTPVGALASPYFQAAVYVLYCTVFIVALCGNGLVCYIVQSSPLMWTVTNYFIVNLAVGDIMLTIFCVPFSFVSTLLLQHWPFGTAMCHTVSYSQAVSVLVSAYTLVAISVDRYMAIMWPLRPRMGKKHAKWIIAGVWIVALATAAPIPIVSKLVQPSLWHSKCNKFVCHEEWGSPTYRNYYR
ncbi:RYamide receptor-like [Anabrus simplex]|uniref:RYamide receptor-like n=1 Tax=Anabrus simplex TaxID=316456 RepID=UPI0035A31E02